MVSKIHINVNSSKEQLSSEKLYNLDDRVKMLKSKLKKKKGKNFLYDLHSGMFTIPQTTKNEVKPLKLSGKKDVNLLYSLSQKNTINAIHTNKEKTAFSGQVSLPDQGINEVLSVTGKNNPVAEDHFQKTFLSERGINDVKSNMNNSLSNADDHEKELLPEGMAYHSGVMQDNSNTPQVNINSLNKKPVENRKQTLNKKNLIPIDSDHNTNAIKDFSYYFSRLTNNSKVIIRYDDARGFILSPSDEIIFNMLKENLTRLKSNGVDAELDDIHYDNNDFKQKNHDSSNSRENGKQ